MAKAILSDREFAEIFASGGAKAIIKATGMMEANVYQRRRGIEKKTGKVLTGPSGERQAGKQRHTSYTPQEYSARMNARLGNGIVLVGSDAHYWPGHISTAHKAFVQFIKELRPDFVVMNGDALDGAGISRHPSIGWEKKPSLIEELEEVQERMHEIRMACKRGARTIWTLGNHDCLDTETECLTKRGWMAHADIRSDDQVLSLDGDKAVWTGIDEIVSGPFIGELVTVDKTRMSMAITPNHRVMLRRLNWRSQKYDIQEFRKASELPYSFNVPTAGNSENVEYGGLSDAKIGLAGWLLTDAHYGKNDAIVLYQSKGDGQRKIETLLEAVGVEYRIADRQRDIQAVAGRALVSPPLPMREYYIGAEQGRKIKEWLPQRDVMPAWAHELSSRQFAILLEAIIDGDGVWDGNPQDKNCAVVYKSETFLSSLQAIAVQHGWRARLAIDNRGDPRLCLSKHDSLRLETKDIGSRPYSGDVWCLRVPLGNFMVRRKGCAYFTGNSRFETKIANVAPEYAKVHGVHLKDHFPEWEPCWSVWVNDSCAIKHRFKGGIHATHNNIIASGKSMVTGHLHSLKVTPYSDYNGTRYGVDTGTLADPYGPQFVNYTEDNPVNWRSGFVVLTFKDGELLWPEVVSVMGPGKVQFRGQVVNV